MKVKLNSSVSLINQYYCNIFVFIQSKTHFTLNCSYDLYFHSINLVLLISALFHTRTVWIKKN